jgi:hypothetical protein
MSTCPDKPGSGRHVHASALYGDAVFQYGIFQVEAVEGNEIVGVGENESFGSGRE